MLDFLLYYNFLPAFLYVVCFFIVMRLLIMPIRYRAGKNFIACVLSGSVGFFIFIPIALYLPYHKSYAFVPIFFFIQAIIGIVGSVYLRVNPFNAKEEILIKMPKMLSSSSSSEKTTVKAQTQSIEESMQMINAELLKAKQPVYSYKEQELVFDGEQFDYNFLLLTPRGVFQIFACNWGGTVSFNDSSVYREDFFEEDSKDFSFSFNYRKRLLKNILHSNGFENVPVHTIFCTTNPSMKAKIQTSAYHVLAPDALVEFLNQDRGSQLKGSELNDLKIAIDNAIVKNK